MRFERHGGPPDLQTAFKRFVEHQLGGRALDDDQDKEAAEGKFPDFACFRDVVLLEMKHLETDQHDRVNQVLRTVIDPAEMPHFFGSRDAQRIIDSVSNGEAVKSAIASKLSRTIEGLLRQANRQFCDYRARHPRKNTVSICVILNASLMEFSPNTVLYAIERKMTPGGDKAQRFPEIDAVLYHSAKHYKVLPDGRVGFAVGIYETPSVEMQPWKVQFIDRIVEAWSEMTTGAPAVHQTTNDGYAVVDDIPKELKRYEAWQLEYQRKPYLSTVTDQRLKVLFNRCFAQTSLAFVKGSWPKPPKEHTAEGMRTFSHLTEEINRRGLDIRQFDPHLLTPEEKAEVYAGLPAELVELMYGPDGAAPA